MKAEEKFLHLIKSRKCEVIRAGWPDYLLFTKEGNPFMVEVKSKNDRLSLRQITMFTALNRMNIKVFVFWTEAPDALLPWKKFMTYTTNMRRKKRTGICAPKLANCLGNVEVAD
jgi:hypothetical protein